MATQKIETGLIADSAVTTAKLADNSVTAAKIAAGSLDDQVKGISSSADAVAITIDSSENVGIGMTPIYRLDVTNNSTGVQGRFSSSSTSGTSLSLQNSATNGRNYRIGSNFVTGTGEFSIYDDTASAERMRIDSSGNVGIGTSTVSRGPLEIHRPSTSDCQIHLTNTSTGTGASNGTTIYANTDSGIWHRENGYFNIATNNTERMRIDSSGNVGIGTDSPDANLEVEGTSSLPLFLSRRVNAVGVGSGVGFRLYDSANNLTNYASIFGVIEDNTNGSEDGGLNFQTLTGNSLTEKMRIDSSGTVMFKGGTTDNAIQIWENNSEITRIGGSSGTLNFLVGSTTESRMSIDSSGNVGIGTTNPSSKLNVVGGASNPGISIKSGGNSGVDPFRVTWVNGTEGDMFIVDDAGNVGIGTTSPTDKLHVVGTSFLNGNTYVGSGGSGNIYLSAGTGIYMNGGTGSANHLDDYEEGTWTPAFAAVTVTSLSYYTKYTKIGNVVYIHAKIDATGVFTTDSSIFTIQGLPYTAKDSGDTQQRSIIYLGGDMISMSDPSGNGTGHFRTNGNDLQGVYVNSSGNTVYWSYSNLAGNDIEFHISGYYFTDS